MGKRQRSPLTGYNHNLGHLGRIFHVQTEDSGPGIPRVFTHLFFQGTILVSRKLEYDAELPDDQVRARMQEQHKSVIRDLLQARLDERILTFFGEAGAQPPGSGSEPRVESGAIPDAPRAEIADARAVVPSEVPARAAATVAQRAVEAEVTDVLDADTAVPSPVSPHHETRPFQGGARGPTPTPLVREQRRVSFGRQTPPPSAKQPSTTDAVVVQRSVVVGGQAAPPGRPARVRASVPYVVTGGGNAQRPARTATGSGTGTGSGSGASSSQLPLEPPVAPPDSSPAPVAVGEPPPRTTGAFGIGLPDDKSLDEVILEYLGEDGEPR